jgi:hypothetical protein
MRGRQWMVFITSKASKIECNLESVSSGICCTRYVYVTINYSDIRQNITLKMRLFGHADAAKQEVVEYYYQ